MPFRGKIPKLAKGLSLSVFTSAFFRLMCPKDFPLAFSVAFFLDVETEVRLFFHFMSFCSEITDNSGRMFTAHVSSFL